MKDIALDGPAGAGKSSIAKMLAKRLNMIYVDTGALYRSLAVYILDKGIDPKDEASVEAAISDVSVRMEHRGGEQLVLVNNVDVTGRLRSEEAGNTASLISAQKAVREKLLSIQRDIAKEKDVVMDGRDIGTVVLPRAYLKVFLTASADERAKRRVLQLREKGENPDFKKIKQDIINRDNQDSTREIAPLKQAEDAVLVDSSNMTIEEVLTRIANLYEGNRC